MNRKILYKVLLLFVLLFSTFIFTIFIQKVVTNYQKQNDQLQVVTVENIQIKSKLEDINNVLNNLNARYSNNFQIQQYNEVYNILSQRDKNFSDVLNNPETNNWKTFTHPDGVFTMKYHPNFRPVVSDALESEYRTVTFVPIQLTPNIKRDMAIPSEKNDFNIKIVFWGLGGGSYCSNAPCIDVKNSEFLPTIKLDSAIEPFWNEKLGNHEIKYQGEFLPIVKSKYSITISSDYYSIDQREVLRLMVSTFKYLGDPLNQFEWTNN